MTFRHPFHLVEIGSPQPPGDYRVVTDEEEILGVSFMAYRRTATHLHLPALAATGLSSQVVQVDPLALEALRPFGTAQGAWLDTALRTLDAAGMAAIGRRAARCDHIFDEDDAFPCLDADGRVVGRVTRAAVAARLAAGAAS